MNQHRSKAIIININQSINQSIKIWTSITININMMNNNQYQYESQLILINIKPHIRCIHYYFIIYLSHILILLIRFHVPSTPMFDHHHSLRSQLSRGNRDTSIEPTSATLLISRSDPSYPIIRGIIITAIIIKYK